MNELKGTITKPPELPFTFGEYVDFVGGRSWRSFSSELVRKGENLRLVRLKRYESVLAGSNLYLNNSSQTEKMALEKMYLKVSVVRDVYQRVQDYRNVTQSAFGEITDATFRVGMEVSHMLAPALWSAFVAVDSKSRKKLVINETMSASGEPKNKRVNECIDHHSLGVLLLRALLANHKQDIAKINRALVTIMKQVEILVQSSELVDRRAALEEFFDCAITNNIFCIGNLEYQPIPVSKIRGYGKIWRRLLFVALRLCSYKVLEKHSGFKLLSREWLSLGSSLLELDKVMSVIKQTMLYEPSNVDENLHGILNSLISDKNWLQESACSHTDPAVHVQPAGAASSRDVSSSNRANQGIRDIRSMLTGKSISTTDKAFEPSDQKAVKNFQNQKHSNPIDSIVDTSLKETVMQASDRLNDVDVWKW